MPGTDYTAQTDLTLTSEAEGDELLVTLENTGAVDVILPDPASPRRPTD